MPQSEPTQVAAQASVAAFSKLRCETLELADANSVFKTTLLNILHTQYNSPMQSAPQTETPYPLVVTPRSIPPFLQLVATSHLHLPILDSGHKWNHKYVALVSGFFHFA